MNRNTATTRVMSYGQQCAKDVCWSSEWSFVEDTDIARHKPARPSLATEQQAENHTNNSATSP